MSFSGSWSRGLLKASSGGVTILLEGRGYPANWGFSQRGGVMAVTVVFGSGLRGYFVLGGISKKYKIYCYLLSENRA